MEAGCGGVVDATSLLRTDPDEDFRRHVKREVDEVEAICSERTESVLLSVPLLQTCGWYCPVLVCDECVRRPHADNYTHTAQWYCVSLKCTWLTHTAGGVFGGAVWRLDDDISTFQRRPITFNYN